MNIKTVLQLAARQLANFSETPELDIELLLAAILNVTRAYLHSHSERSLTAAEQLAFEKSLERRLGSEPIAYILQRQAFWNLDLLVTSAVLIPRPETELLVEIILEKFSAMTELQIADLGTGSGAIALALAKERSCWHLTATDYSLPALAIAKQNAKQLQLSNVEFYQGSWCAALPNKKFDVIVSNPPYIAAADLHLLQASLQHEPQQALIAGADGLEAITSIINEAHLYLSENGLLLFEHGYQQAAAVRHLFATANYKEIVTYQDFAGHERVTIGKRGVSG